MSPPLDLGPAAPWVSPATAAVFARLVARGDPYELGLAADWGPRPLRVQLSYNPRRNRPDTRAALLDALAALGFDRRAPAALLDLLPAASVVLGVEDQGAEATLYLEELHRQPDPWAPAVNAAARLLGPKAAPIPVVGPAPYILALDLIPGKARPQAIKLYGLFDQPPAGPPAPAFAGPVPALAWMVQRRWKADGRVDTKRYQTWDYHPDPDPRLPAFLAELGAPVQLAPGAPATSIGQREDGQTTVYWCLRRGAEPVYDHL